ncbi:unnamed protein product [Brassicogethes aeneus]|uniref:ferroxidase n=1 Tax=Brassicogethes aeneus TaxID=1431903 RepID=A0A9P0BBU2_BRAAE|nr:unnamed protein product [Brassicogethes aeneus]
MNSLKGLLRVGRCRTLRCLGTNIQIRNKIKENICSRNIAKNNVNCRFLSSSIETTVDTLVFEKACEETLESLSDYFEEVIENCDYLQKADVSYSSGVLTVNLGDKHGTYVINRQSPNKQIWLSSPTSGPKRYDYEDEGKCWIYKRDGKTLHQLLQDEISKVVDVDFSRCDYAKL